MLDECSFGVGMTVIALKLDSKVAHWNFDTVLQVERLIEEIIEMAESDALDVLPSRSLEQ